MTVSEIPVTLPAGSYTVTVGSGLLAHADEYMDLDRRVMIVTDSGVPEEYAKALAARCREAYIHVFPQGEENKTVQTYEDILGDMLSHGFTRPDCVAAVGGGVVGDTAGFAAATYMRGVDFYNLPTTLLSMVDSSVGGKTGVDFHGIKNIVGAFWQPKAVLADTDTLSSLPRRQVVNGLAEALKMAVTFDPALFALFEEGDPFGQLPGIIVRSVELKRDVVEQDEREAGLRRVLNFGHTLGHGIESLGLDLYHGECVALGMLPMCAPALAARLIPIYEKLGLPAALTFDREAAFTAVTHDKKAASGGVNAVFSARPGDFSVRKVTPEELHGLLERVPGLLS